MIDKIAQVYQDKVLYKQWLLEEGFTITYEKIFEWDSDKANKVWINHQSTDFRMVSTIFMEICLKLKLNIKAKRKE